ncbi:hypothetical protein [uncultured Clostridium sp.]|nr:hypothetical protein [uncultured Clostridium sp.]
MKSNTVENRRIKDVSVIDEIIICADFLVINAMTDINMILRDFIITEII